MASTMNLGARRPDEHYWWDDIPEPVKIDIRATGEQAKELEKATKVRQGFCLVFFNIIIRIYCFAIGVLMMAYGGWIIYQIVNSHILPLSILANVAMGGFLLLAGLLTVLAETRNRRTMKGCLNTYILISNHLARGIYYIVVGGLTFPIDITIPYIGQFGNSKVLAGFIVAGGIMNLVYYPFRYRFARTKENSEQVRGIANAEELVYEMHITNTTQIKTPVGEPQVLAPPVTAGKSDLELQSIQQMHEDDTNGATPEDLSLSKLEKGKEKEKQFNDIEAGGASIGAGVPVM